MSSTTYGAIKLTTAEEVGTILKKKIGTVNGYKPKEWADTINLLGKLPIRTASGSIAHFEDGADDVPLKSLTAQIVPIQSGTGDPSPSNPRPISGTSVLNVTRTGKNLFPFGTVSGTTYTEKTLSLKPSTYTLSLVASGNSSTKMRTIFQFTDNSYGGECLFEKDTREAKTVTLAKPVKALLFYAADSYPTSVGFEFEYSDIQIEVGSTATTYEPYTGSTYTIALGRTVYGGSADVVEGSGSGEKVLDTIVDSGWSKFNNFFYRSYSDKKRTTTADEYPLLCSMAKNGGTITSSTSFRDGFIYQNATNENIYIVDSSVASIEAFYTKYGGCQICYELATPTDFTFEGEEINSLEGVNNVYVDSGEVLDVEYRADIDLLIASLEGIRGLQMLRATPTEETEQTEEDEEDEGER